MKLRHDHSAKGNFGLNEYLHNAKCKGYKDESEKQFATEKNWKSFCKNLDGDNDTSIRCCSPPRKEDR